MQSTNILIGGIKEALSAPKLTNNNIGNDMIPHNPKPMTRVTLPFITQNGMYITGKSNGVMAGGIKNPVDQYIGKQQCVIVAIQQYFNQYGNLS